MGRKSKHKIPSQADPERAERIRAMREREAATRATMDSAYKTARDLADRMHYDRLAKECDERFRALHEEFPKLLERRLELASECFSASCALTQECNDLQKQLALREAQLPTPAERVAPDISEKVTAYLAAVDAHVAAMEHEVHCRFEIHEEAIRRGWAVGGTLESAREDVERAAEQIESGVAPLRDALRKLSAEHERLKARRQDLLNALDQLRESPQ